MKSIHTCQIKKAHKSYIDCDFVMGHLLVDAFSRGPCRQLANRPPLPRHILKAILIFTRSRFRFLLFSVAFIARCELARSRFEVRVMIRCNLSRWLGSNWQLGGSALSDMYLPAGKESLTGDRQWLITGLPGGRSIHNSRLRFQFSAGDREATRDLR